jgi:hypothetical protein
VHLGNTRTLVIEDEPAPQEYDGVEPSVDDQFSARAHPLPEDVRDRRLKQIVGMFSKDEMRSFRLVKLCIP